MAVTKGIRQLVQEAEQKISTVSVTEAVELLKDDSVQFVDIRDVRELWRDGTIPGALHVPRGMIEFWVDPDSPYHKPIFASDKKFLLFCASNWRSALATKALVEMGMTNVCHLGGGFTEWKKQNAPVAPVEPKSS